jgi:hypothetical protein
MNLALSTEWTSLRHAFEAENNAEALHIMEALTASHEIYMYYKTEAYYLNNHVRSLLMKKYFHTAYQQHQAVQPEAKYLIKLGANHIETIADNLQGADIVYSWCRVTGDRIAYNQYQVPFDADELARQNYIPNVAAIRTELWDSLGGQRSVPEEDWDFWRRAVAAGAHFVCVPKVTWTYRMGDWPHRSDVV